MFALRHKAGPAKVFPSDWVPILSHSLSTSTELNPHAEAMQVLLVQTRNKDIYVTRYNCKAKWVPFACPARNAVAPRQTIMFTDTVSTS